MSTTNIYYHITYMHEALAYRKYGVVMTHACRPNLYGKRKDPGKMTYSRTALVERGLGDKRAHANEHVGGRCVGCRGEQASAQACGGLAPAQASKRTLLIDAFAQQVEEVGIHTCGARTRAVQQWAARAEARAALEASICSMLTYVRVPASNANRSRTLYYGKSEDPAKMAISRLALTERGPGFLNPKAK